MCFAFCADMEEKSCAPNIPCRQGGDQLSGLTPGRGKLCASLYADRKKNAVCLTLYADTKKKKLHALHCVQRGRKELCASHSVCVD